MEHHTAQFKGGTNASEYIHIREEQASGVAAGTFTGGAWRTRVLNTIVTDDTGKVTLSSNQFVLPAGTYSFQSEVPTRMVVGHQSRLQNITDATTIQIGTNAMQKVGDNDVGHAHVEGQFTITASTTFELQHRCLTTRATDGFGVQNSWGTEVYATIELRKVA